MFVRHNVRTRTYCLPSVLDEDSLLLRTEVSPSAAAVACLRLDTNVVDTSAVTAGLPEVEN